jgi:uncharacterized protein (DUF1697 family)
MTTWIGLLRAVNLGAHNKISMSDLRDLLIGLGARDAKTLLQSGNVLFMSDVRFAAALEQQIEAALSKRLSVATDVFVRSARDWKAIIAANPFAREAKQDPSHLLVMPLKAAPKPASVKALQRAIQGREIVQADGACVYLVYPDGIGRSRLTTAVVEKHLETRGTARNWNTVLKLDALADSMA